MCEVRASENGRENGRRTAGLPKRSFNTCSSSTLAGDFGPLHRGPISRPYPTREPLLIGAPRAGSAEPTDGQAIAASDTTIRNCIQCQQETIKLRPRYSTFAQHPPRLMQNPLTRITPHRNPAVWRRRPPSNRSRAAMQRRTDDRLVRMVRCDHKNSHALALQ